MYECMYSRPYSMKIKPMTTKAVATATPAPVSEPGPEPSTITKRVPTVSPAENAKAHV